LKRLLALYGDVPITTCADPDNATKINAAKALSEIERQRILETSIQRLKGRGGLVDPRPKELAIEALGTMGGNEAVEALQSFIIRAPAYDPYIYKARRAAVGENRQ
jgi:hypothetical protein